MSTKFCRGIVFVCLTTITLSGCNAVDSFGSRALQYNEEAAHTKSSTILLNILRSTYRLPLQFTEFTTTTGQSFAQGQLSATVPLTHRIHDGRWLASPLGAG